MSLYFKDLRASFGGWISLHPISRNGVLFCASLLASVAFAFLMTAILTMVRELDCVSAVRAELRTLPSEPPSVTWQLNSSGHLDVPSIIWASEAYVLEGSLGRLMEAVFPMLSHEDDVMCVLYFWM